MPLAAAVREALADVDLDPERKPSLQQIFPELGLGAPKHDADELEALEALVALLGAHSPVLLLIDDLHLADHRTLAAIGYVRRRAAFPGAIVTTAAPTNTSPGQPPHRLHADLRLHLEPLSRDDLEAAGIADLHESTGGDPRLVAEALACGARRSAFEDADRRAARPVPRRGRLGAPRPRRRLGARAAVRPSPCWPSSSAEEAAELVEELERLCERRILRVDGLRFRFRNDLARQVLLESISPARQRLLRERLDADVISTAPSRTFAIGLKAS